MRWWFALALVAACDRGTDNDPEPIDVTAAWQVRCPGCTYEAHVFDGPVEAIGFGDDYVDCTRIQDFVDVELGHVTTANSETTGFNLKASFGFDGAALDLDRQCRILVLETDGTSWAEDCSESVATSCTVTNPRLDAGGIAFSLQCTSMQQQVRPAGTRADVAAATSAGAPVDIRIGRCTL
jgi:hypothetical protein